MSAPDVCKCCEGGDHVWTLLNECHCPFCYCTAVRVPSVLGLKSEDDAETAIYTALGAASACWSTLESAGEFNSSRAKAIGEELIRHLRALRLLPDPAP